MQLLTERPWTTDKVAFLARRLGQYTRPVIGAMVDFRIEDILPDSVIHSQRSINLIGKLPDIPAAHQVGKYFASVFNDVQIVDSQTALKYVRTQDFLVLPDNDKSEYWQYTHAPWWEFVVVLDDYQGYIKAPYEHKSRSGEPTPQDADEKIDEYPTNQNTITVLAPATIEMMHKNKLTESYYQKLKRIF